MRPDDIKSDRAGHVIKLPQDYWAFIPSRLPPTLTYNESLARLLAEAGASLGELAGTGRMLPNPYILIGPAMRREAVLSSKIEGTQSDIDDLYYYEAEPEETPHKPDVREVHNYVVALVPSLINTETIITGIYLISAIKESGRIG